jgi:DNA-binding response OmpR family regulator
VRLLLVEDDPSIARFIKKGLEAEHYQVDVAEDGERAVEMAPVTPYSLIILEVLLPRMDGLAVCRELRAHGLKTPILMLTVRDTLSDKVAGLRAGADDYMTKPFAFEELVARIRALLRRQPTLDISPALAAADLLLDRETHEVRRGGRLIELTALEFALLEYLMERVGRVSSRSVIEAHVWGMDHDPSTNVVDVYISRLRHKIDRDAAVPLIHTVRGVGYVLKA